MEQAMNMDGEGESLLAEIEFAVFYLLPPRRGQRSTLRSSPLPHALCPYPAPVHSYLPQQPSSLSPTTSSTTFFAETEPQTHWRSVISGGPH